jgi:hypothetical protein
VSEVNVHSSRTYTNSLQAYDMVSSPGSKQVILCGFYHSPSKAPAQHQQHLQQQNPWQWWQTRNPPAADLLESEEGLSWHAGAHHFCFILG